MQATRLKTNGVFFSSSFFPLIQRLHHNTLFKGTCYEFPPPLFWINGKTIMNFFKTFLFILRSNPEYMIYW